MTQAKNNQEPVGVIPESRLAEIEQVEATDFPAPSAVEERLRMLEEYAAMAHGNRSRETD